MLASFFVTYTGLCSSCHHRHSGDFHHLKKTPYSLAVTPQFPQVFLPVYPPDLGNQYTSVSIDFPIADIAYEWNYVICDLL